MVYFGIGGGRQAVLTTSVAMPTVHSDFGWCGKLVVLVGQATSGSIKHAHTT